MTSDNERRSLLLEGKPYKLVWTLSLPAVVGMVVVALYSFMDSIFVGQFVNEYAMAAVSVVYPFTLINSGVAVLVGIGSASVLSRAIGRQDSEVIKKITPNLTAMVILFSMIITVVMIAFAPQILMLTGAEGEIYDQAVTYMRIVFVGSLFVNFAQGANMIMRGEGAFKKAMMFMAFGAILNIVIDPFLIIAFGENGIIGAALATVIAQVCQATLTLVYFVRRDDELRLNTVRFERSISKEVSAVGVSAMLMQVLTLVQQTLLLWSVAKYGGSDYQVVASAILRVQAFAFIPLWGISQGYQPAAGMNYGAQRYDRVIKCTNAFIVSATAVALLYWLCVMMFPQPILSLFITDPVIAAMGAEVMRIAFMPFFCLGAMIIVITLLQATGDAKVAAGLTLLRQVVLYIPLMIIVPVLWTPSVYGVFWAMAITEIIVTIVCAVVLATRYKRLNEMEVGIGTAVVA